MQPDDKRLWRRLVEEYKHQKLWKPAATMLEDKIKKEADHETLVELLEIYTVTADRDGMVSVLRKILERDPGDLTSRSRLAALLEKKGAKKAAIREYETLLKGSASGADRLSIYKRLGYLYAQTGQSNR